MDLDHERCYRAVASRDARFDGAFYTAVRTTGIYCRPSCPAITPKRANVTFFPTPAAAQRDGFRACRRCRPDAVPGSVQWNVRGDVVARAMRLVADGAVERLGVAGVAQALGYSERHLNRLVTDELGAGLLAIARTQRAHTARILLETTGLPAGEVAWAAGFASIRSFNDTISAVYGLSPTALRRRGRRAGPSTAPPSGGASGSGRAVAGGGGSGRSVAGGAADGGAARGARSHGGPPHGGPSHGAQPHGARSKGAQSNGGRPGSGTSHGSLAASAGLDPGGALQSATPIRVRLAAREPFDPDSLLAFLGQRAIPGLESWDGARYRRTLALPHGHATVSVQPTVGGLDADFHLSDLRDLGAGVARVRRLFDLDADPVAVGEVLGADPMLGPLVAARPGLRISGSVDPHEIVVRAIVGQQVSVAGARTVVGRFVAAHGEPLALADPELTRVFPSAERLAAADPTALSMPRARGAALVGVCRALAEGGLVLDPGADRQAVAAQLQGFAGIGPWTTAYVAMRGLGDPDIMLAGDLGVRHAVAALGGDDRPRAIERAAHAWRPWRSYAVAHLWASLAGGAVAQPGVGRSSAGAPAAQSGVGRSSAGDPAAKCGVGRSSAGDPAAQSGVGRSSAGDPAQSGAKWSLAGGAVAQPGGEQPHLRQQRSRLSQPQPKSQPLRKPATGSGAGRTTSRTGTTPDRPRHVRHDDPIAEDRIATMNSTVSALVRRTIDSPVGLLTLVASPAGVRAVLWPGEDGSRIARSIADAAGQRRRTDQRSPADDHDRTTAGERATQGDRAESAHVRAQAHLDQAADQLAQYFAGERTTFDVPLDPVGTDFQRGAWAVLAQIPYGQTMSYRAQAAVLGDPGKARAVGAANGRNPISIIVPCHRVVASSGALTGFAGGMDLKAWLLDHERRVLAAAAPGPAEAGDEGTGEGAGS